MGDVSRFTTYHSSREIPRFVLDGLVKAYIQIFSESPWHEAWSPEEVIAKLQLEISKQPAFLTVMRGDDEYPIGGFCWGAVIPVASIPQRVRGARHMTAVQSAELEAMAGSLRASQILFVDELAIIPRFRDGMRPIASVTLPLLRMARNAGTGVICWSTKESQIVPILLHYRFKSIATIGEIQFLWVSARTVRYLNSITEDLAYKLSDSKKDIIASAISPYEQYCTGHGGGHQYFTALIMGIGSSPKTFTHSGSNVLDSVLAYDRAEVHDIYLGQINMAIVSSFCGPSGLIWGYDIVPSRQSAKIIEEAKEHPELRGIPVYSGEGLRTAARMLFGTNKKRRFPFLPGSHVFCAGRYVFIPGPALAYAAIGIGIPQDRSRTAAVFMEDAGQIFFEKDTSGKIDKKRTEIMLNMARSVVKIGKNQRVKYKEIIVDCIMKKIPAGEIGCSLVAIPYFHLAKSAHTETLEHENLESWALRTQDLAIDS